MTTAETSELADRFTALGHLSQAKGDFAAARAWFRAALLTTEAECESITAALDRSVKRRTPKASLHLVR